MISASRDHPSFYVVTLMLSLFFHIIAHRQTPEKNQDLCEFRDAAGQKAARDVHLSNGRPGRFRTADLFRVKEALSP